MRRTAVALIDEARCIGCARCIEACPFDAIVGAGGHMHTVVAPWCTGCRLCLPPCPVDCISLPAPREPWTAALARAAGQRVRRRKLRRSRRFAARAADPQRRRAILAAAIERKRST